MLMIIRKMRTIKKLKIKIHQLKKKVLMMIYLKLMNSINFLMNLKMKTMEMDFKIKKKVKRINHMIKK